MEGERSAFGMPEPGADETASLLGNYESPLAKAEHPVLRKLAEYEEACGHPVAGCASFFIDMPRTPEAAEVRAAEIGASLREFAHYNIAPLVFIEPTTDEGVIDFRKFYEGAYDATFATLFARLCEKEGITDEMMGTWVPFPEANTPVWGNVQPNDVTRCLSRFAWLQKVRFPASRVSVLLNSKTYPYNDSWNDGTYASLQPYVEHVRPGLIDSLGIQGFAWPPDAPGGGAVLDPAVFLRPDLATSAAYTLGVREVWFNTGTFGRAGRVARELPYEVAPERRQAILEGIVAQAEVVRTYGMRPAIHLFSENKYDSREAIDWSYWPQGQPLESVHTPVFKALVRRLETANIPLWLFDSAN